MAKVVVIGSGFAGHTAALYLGNRLGREHQVTVITNNERFSYLPSWVWVGVDHMKPEKTVFELKPVYDRIGVKLVHAAAKEIHPDAGDQYVIGEDLKTKAEVRLDYDYLVVATGPKLNFAGTPGLGPDDGFTNSICSLPHAIKTRDAYLASVEKMKKGEKQRIVIGTGHPGSTCQGAAFEYLENIHKDLVKKGLRDKADLMWLSNEPALGDFGVHGVQVKKGDSLLASSDFIEAVFADQGIKWQVQSGVKKVDKDKIYWENYEGEEGETGFDFAMLIPQFLGQPIKYIGKDGEDLADKVQGGEVSGSIDESARHAISKFAQFHFPSTQRAAEFLRRMGERPETILSIGCPSSDIAATIDRALPPEVVNSKGSGAPIDTDKPFLLVVFHPTTTQFGDERVEMEEVLGALEWLAKPTLLLWPNIDAGSDHVSKAIRVFRESKRPMWLRTIINVSPDDYLKILANASCAIGNSSSFVRDASYFGTPVVLVGMRQDGRETDIHVLRVDANRNSIVSATQTQLLHGRYPASTLYGDGRVSRRIAEALARLQPYVQKQLDYVNQKGLHL